MMKFFYYFWLIEKIITQWKKFITRLKKTNLCNHEGPLMINVLIAFKLTNFNPIPGILFYIKSFVHFLFWKI